MATEFRIDEWINHPDGVIEVQFTYGTTPLPSNWTGSALRFMNGVPEVDALISKVEDTCIQPDLMLGMLAARFKRQSPNYSLTPLIEGRSFTYDPNSQQIIQIN